MDLPPLPGHPPPLRGPDRVLHAADRADERVHGDDQGLPFHFAGSSQDHELSKFANVLQTFVRNLTKSCRNFGKFGAASRVRFSGAWRGVGLPRLRRRMNNELNFPPNFERLVLGCIDADFCK